MSAQSSNRQPWPMKWILLAIVLAIVPYTFLTLHYRKNGPAFQPYEELKNRTNVGRLLAAGYRRVPLLAQRPADNPHVGTGASVLPAPGGLPTDVRTTLVEKPLLPVEVLTVTAAPASAHDQPYAIQLTCALPDDKQQLAGGDLYIRSDQVVITPTFEHVPADLLTRSRQAAVLLTIPAGTLNTGRYMFTVVGERASRAWPVEVK